MKLAPFLLRDYFAKWGVIAPHSMCRSDVESLYMKELIQMADQEALNLWENLSLSYTDKLGMPLLREEISSDYANSDLICFAGAEEGIFCTTMGLLEKGDHVVVVTPCYQSLWNVPEAQGA